MAPNRYTTLAQLHEDLNPPNMDAADPSEVGPSEYHAGGYIGFTGGDAAPLQQLAQEMNGEKPTEGSCKRKKSSVWFKKAEKISTPPLSSVNKDNINADQPCGVAMDRVLENAASSPSVRELNRRRSEYFEEVFAIQEPLNNGRYKYSQDPVIVIEIQTNIAIPDTFHAIALLSSKLNTILYGQGQVMIHLHDSASLYFSGSFEPTYYTTVTALPYLVGPLTNQRHTVLIQAALLDVLNISANRGIIKFEAVPDENLGTNGTTFRDEIEQLEKRTSTASSDGMMSRISRTMSRRSRPSVSRAQTRPFQGGRSVAVASSSDFGSSSKFEKAPFVPSTARIRHTQSFNLEHMRLATTFELPEHVTNEEAFAADPEASHGHVALKKKSNGALKAYKSFKKLLLN